MKLSFKPLFSLLLLAVLASPLSAFALFERCKDFFPNQRIPSAAQAGKDLCFDVFAIYYSPTDKKPIYTVEHLSQDPFLGKHPRRSNRFYEEARLPFQERALLSDYRGSGYDRGHNVPAGDMNTEQGMAQSFSLANMMPQARLNNQGIWAKNVEEPTRQYAKRTQGGLYVFTGSTGSLGSIGEGHVTIPSHLYKLVYDPVKNTAWAYWIENSDDARMTPPISYPALVQKTGIDFHLPIEGAHLETAQPTQKVGGWYPVFFDSNAPGKVDAIITQIKAGKVASVQVQYDRNQELAMRIANQIEQGSGITVNLSQNSPPESATVTYERNRVSAIVHLK